MEGEMLKLLRLTNNIAKCISLRGRWQITLTGQKKKKKLNQQISKLVNIKDVSQS